MRGGGSQRTRLPLLQADETSLTVEQLSGAFTNLVYRAILHHPGGVRLLKALLRPMHRLLGDALACSYHRHGACTDACASLGAESIC